MRFIEKILLTRIVIPLHWWQLRLNFKRNLQKTKNKSKKKFKLLSNKPRFRFTASSAFGKWSRCTWEHEQKMIKVIFNDARVVG